MDLRWWSCTVLHVVLWAAALSAGQKERLQMFSAPHWSPQGTAWGCWWGEDTCYHQSEGNHIEFLVSLFCDGCHNLLIDSSCDIQVKLRDADQIKHATDVSFPHNHRFSLADKKIKHLTPVYSKNLKRKEKIVPRKQNETHISTSGPCLTVIYPQILTDSRKIFYVSVTAVYGPLSRSTLGQERKNSSVFV